MAQGERPQRDGRFPSYIYLKDESAYPTGSLKHRLARCLFLYGICNGRICGDTPIVEVVVGFDGGVGSSFCAAAGMPFYAVMPATTSKEKIAAIEHQGGRCHLVQDGRTIYAEAAKLAEQLNGVYLDQFTFAEGNEPHPAPAWVVMSAAAITYN